MSTVSLLKHFQENAWYCVLVNFENLIKPFDWIPETQNVNLRLSQQAETNIKKNINFKVELKKVAHKLKILGSGRVQAGALPLRQIWIKKSIILHLDKVGPRGE